MRSLLFVGLVVVLGAALGVGAASLRIKITQWNPTIDKLAEKTTPPLTSPPNGPTPRVVVDKIEHDFGRLNIDSSGGSHEFTFTNAGDAPLTLSDGGTSCRCALSKLDQKSISPGGSAKVTVTWKSIDKLGPYQQTASILTNDPAQPKVTLTVSGRVTAAMRFSPAGLVFSRLSAGETSVGQSRLFCYLDAPVKILRHTWSNPATASYFDVARQPLSAEEIKGEPSAQSGELVTVTVKPGLPQGPFHQKLIFQTDTALSPTLLIEGNIGSEIAVVGRGWNPDTGVLNCGEVSGRTGLQRRLLLVVRGPLRKEVQFKPSHVAPSVLKVSLGQRTEINKGAVVQIPLIIDIPPGSPPANHLGSEQGSLGEIILETTHPKVPTLRIFVRFAIEG